VNDPLVVCPQQTLGGEQSHLSVVGDRTNTTVGFSKVSYSGFAEGLPDLSETHELNRSAQGITNRTTKQTPPKP
jgi:hypothetical protein